MKKIKHKWPNAYWRVKKSKLKESKLLKLNSKKSQKLLRWKCVLSFTQTLNLVLDWYKHYYEKNEYETIFDKPNKVLFFNN